MRPGAASSCRVRKRLWLSLLVLIGVAGVLLLAFTWLPKARSYFLDVESFGVELRSAGLSMGEWRLRKGVIVCARMEAPPAVPKHAHPQCSPASYAVGRIDRPLAFGWDAGAALRVGVTGTGDLVVDLEDAPDGGIAIGDVAADLGVAPDGAPFRLRETSRIIIPRQVLVESGALPLVGAVVVGDTARAGATGLMVGGAFAVRERLVWSPTPATIKEGTLAFGDRVSFSAPDSGSVASYAYLTANVSSDRGGSGPNPFRLVVSTEPTMGDMRIERLGSAPNVVSPSWTDRALRDPLVLGLTALVSLSAILVTLAVESRNLLLSGEGGSALRRQGARRGAVAGDAPPAPADRAGKRRRRPRG